MPPAKTSEEEKAVQGSSRLTAREQILRFMEGRLDVVTTSKIACEIQANLSAIYMALRQLVDDGELVRVRAGMYANPGVVNPPKDPAPPPRPPTDGPAWMNVPSETQFLGMTALQAEKARREQAKAEKAAPPLVNVNGPPITDLVTPMFNKMQAEDDAKSEERNHIVLAPPDEIGGPAREIRVKDEAEAERLRQAESVQLRFREAQRPTKAHTEPDDAVWARYQEVLDSAAVGPASPEVQAALQGGKQFQQSMDAVVQQLDDLAADAELEEEPLAFIYRSDGSMQLTVGGYDIEIPPAQLLQLARFLARLV